MKKENCKICGKNFDDDDLNQVKYVLYNNPKLKNGIWLRACPDCVKKYNEFSKEEICEIINHFHLFQKLIYDVFENLQGCMDDDLLENFRAEYLNKVCKRI